jgi:hypothetical protein
MTDMSEKYPMCAGCQFGPTPDYSRGSKLDLRSHELAASLGENDALVCHRREQGDAHYDPNLTLGTYECGGAARVRDARLGILR